MIKKMYRGLENVRKSVILGKRTGRFKGTNEISWKGNKIYNEQFIRGINSKLNIDEHKITELEDRSEKVTQNESQRSKK